ncbi:MAG: hypothetical protein ACLQKA_18905 [Bryobacteraceae bacterium]
MLLKRLVSTVFLALFGALVWSVPALGQTTAQADPPPLLAGGPPAVRPVAPPMQVQEDKRIFGVLPNNRTTEDSIPFQPITAKQKVTIAFKDSFDYPVFPTAAAFAALYQIENQNPSFGQGMAGYSKRFGTAYGDQMIGNMMTEGFIPALFHQDPRYFRLGSGSKLHRTLHALEAIEVARMDSGRLTFNFSEWGGNAAAAAISNAYYPDTRDWSDNLQRLLVACGTDAFSNVLKEFWPDVKRKFHKHHDQDPPVSSIVQ